MTSIPSVLAQRRCWEFFFGPKNAEDLFGVSTQPSAFADPFHLNVSSAELLSPTRLPCSLCWARVSTELSYIQDPSPSCGVSSASGPLRPAISSVPTLHTSHEPLRHSRTLKRRRPLCPMPTPRTRRPTRPTRPHRCSSRPHDRPPRKPTPPLHPSSIHASRAHETTDTLT